MFARLFGGQKQNAKPKPQPQPADNFKEIEKLESRIRVLENKIKEAKQTALEKKK